MQDNTTRGKRVTLWLKILIVLLIAATVLPIFFSTPQTSWEQVNNNLPLVLLLFISILLFSVIVAIFISRIFWLLWIFQAEENLRQKTVTTFSPWTAVVLSFFCPIMDAFILKDIVKNTELKLGEKLPDNSGAPINLVPVFISFALMVLRICYVFIPVTIYVDNTISSIILVAMMICLVRAIEPFLQKEQQLFNIYQNEDLNRKVDEILRERKIEEAARMVQEAKYDNE